VIPIWKAAAPAIDILAPDDYQGDPAAYVKVSGSLSPRRQSPLPARRAVVSWCDPDSGDFTRYFFSVLGLQGIGYSESGNQPVPSLARNFVLVGPMQREIARLNFEGKLKAVAEPRTLQGRRPGRSQADDAVRILERSGEIRSQPALVQPPPHGIQKPEGRALVAQLGENQFLVAGYFCTVDFYPAGTEEQQKTEHIVDGTGQIPSALIDGKWQHRQFMLVEQGVYEDGTSSSCCAARMGMQRIMACGLARSPRCCASRWPPISEKRVSLN
jgi:hypothetical protein